MIRTAAVLIALGSLACEFPRQPLMPDIDGFAARTYAVGALHMPYRLFTPMHYDKAKRYPLIVWLHGAGGSGTDNIRQISGDQVPGTHLWISKQSQARNPVFVVAPQINRVLLIPQDAVELQPEARVVGEIVDSLAAEYPIDVQRIYLIGQSLGAGVAWNLVTNQPERFAAVLLVCPAGVRSLARASAAARVPLWAIVGAVDTYKTYTQNLIDDLKESGGHPKFTIYPDLGHEIWDRAFAEPDLAPWLFAQSR